MWTEDEKEKGRRGYTRGELRGEGKRREEKKREESRVEEDMRVP